MKKTLILLLFVALVFSSYSEGKRDLLQNEAKQINLGNDLLSDFAELGFPTYKSRDFWNSLPEESKNNTYKVLKNILIMTGRW